MLFFRHGINVFQRLASKNTKKSSFENTNTQDHTQSQNNRIGFINPGSVTEENELGYTGLQRHINNYEKLDIYENNYDSGYMDT